MRLQTALLLTLLAATPALAQESWPTLHHDVPAPAAPPTPRRPLPLPLAQTLLGRASSPPKPNPSSPKTPSISAPSKAASALNADTGDELWNVDLAAPIHHAPAYDNGRIYAATLGGVVVACDARTGHGIALRRPPPRRLAASPAVSGNRLYLGDRAGDLHALDAATGHPVWSARLPAPILQTVSIKDNKLAVAAEDLIPRLFDTATGQELWHGRQMAGVTVRTYYPVFWNDLVVWPPTPTPSTPTPTTSSKRPTKENSGATPAASTSGPSRPKTSSRPSPAATPTPNTPTNKPTSAIR